MAEATDPPSAAPKLHGTFTLTRLPGAGVALEDLGTEENLDRVVLEIGDSATNLALHGTLDEVQWLITQAGAQLARLRRSQQRHAASEPGNEEARDRYRRMVAAATISPATDLTAAGHVVLSWLAHADEPVCAGVVELINAARALGGPPVSPEGPAPIADEGREPW